MEKASTKSSLKFVKNTSQSTAAQWSITNNNARGMARDEVKDRFQDKNNKSSSSQSRKSSPPKENTKPQEFKLHTQERAVKRAMFNYAVTTKFYLMEIQKRQAEKLQKMIEEEEIRMLRKEMVPRAQLMPYFDKPFSPQSLIYFLPTNLDFKQFLCSKPLLSFRVTVYETFDSTII
ncbi:hypothetical protein AHAS_Ahas13G0431100 [Arachis hypogaea]